MPILTNAEEQKKNELKEERRQIIKKFAGDVKNAFLIWIKIGSVFSTMLVLVYLFIKFMFKWDLFYETDLDYKAVFLFAFLSFLGMVISCWFVAFFLYNTKHRRNTKYKLNLQEQNDINR